MQVQVFDFEVSKSWDLTIEILGRAAGTGGGISLQACSRLKDAWSRKPILEGLPRETARVEVVLRDDLESLKQFFNKFPLGDYVSQKPKVGLALLYVVRVLQSRLGLYFTAAELIWNRISKEREINMYGKKLKLQEGMKFTRAVRSILIQFHEALKRPLNNQLLYCTQTIEAFGENWEFLLDDKEKFAERVCTLFSPFVGGNDLADTRVVFSANPLDIILVSEFTAGTPPWKSCNRLYGEYRTAPLVGLVSPYHAVAYAYRHTSTNAPFNGVDAGFVLSEESEVPLPVKLWRQWVFVNIDDGTAVFMKHYPAPNELYSRVARQLTARTFGRIYGKEIEHYRITRREWALNRIEICNGPFFYLDPISSAISVNGTEWNSFYFDITRFIPCLGCGQWRDDNMTDSLICYECNNYVRCCECDAMVYSDDAYWARNSWWCPECFRENFVHCGMCGDAVEYEDAEWVWREDMHVCPRCYDRYVDVCDYCGNATRRNRLFEYDDGALCCDWCAVYCCSCGMRFPREEGGRAGREWYCPQCLNAFAASALAAQVRGAEEDENDAA